MTGILKGEYDVGQAAIDNLIAYREKQAAPELDVDRDLIGIMAIRACSFPHAGSGCLAAAGFDAVDRVFPASWLFGCQMDKAKLQDLFEGLSEIEALCAMQASSTELVSLEMIHDAEKAAAANDDPVAYASVMRISTRPFMQADATTRCSTNADDDGSVQRSDTCQVAGTN